MDRYTVISADFTRGQVSSGLSAVPRNKKLHGGVRPLVGGLQQPVS